MKFERPYTPHPSGFSVVAVAHYCGSAWNLVRNSDDKIIVTGSVKHCIVRRLKETGVLPFIGS